MFHLWQDNEKQYVTVSLIGEHFFKGVIIDSGNDIIVLFDGKNFLYIPISHIEYIEADIPDTEIVEPSSTLSILSTNPQKELTFDRILKEAKGIYVEIYILNKKPLHGTILEILDDYIVFYSPIYKKIYCPKDHLKWLIPYSTTERPYNLSASEYNWLHVEKGFEKNLNLQLKKSLNKLIVINFGEKTHHIGKIISINDKMLELRTVKEESVYVNIEHVQTISEV